MAVARKRGSVLVATRPIPRFRILSDLERRAEKDMNTFLRQAIREIQSAITSAPVDPAEQALIEAAALARNLGVSDRRILELIGADLGGAAEEFDDLRKSAGSPGLFDPEDQEVKLEEKRGLALIAHEIRSKYGAPTSPAGWLEDRDDEVVDGLLAMVPFRMGRLVPNRAGARDLPPRFRQGREPERRPVALVDEFNLNQNARSHVMRAILKGNAAQVPEVILHPLAEGMEPVYSVVSGMETFLLAFWAGIPALEMDVWEPEKAPPADPTMLPAIDDMEALHRLMFEKFWPHQYKVPPALEPIAVLARQMSRREFVDAFDGRPSEEEIDARQETDLSNASRTSIWISLFRAARASGVSTETARRRAEGSLEWRRATSSWRSLARKARRLEEEGHARRERVRLAKAEALNLARELALPLAGPGVGDDFTLWMEARHGRIDDVLHELEEEIRDPEEHPHPVTRSRRLPNYISERRHPNLREVDGHPRVFTFYADEVPHEPEPPGEAEQIGEETYVPGANRPPPDAFRFENEIVPVVGLEPQRADGGTGEPRAEPSEAEPALVISVPEPAG